MEAINRRRKEDLEKIKALASLYPGRVELLEYNRSISSIKLRLKVPTSRDSNYPHTVQESSDILFELPQRYPFEEPLAKVLTPIWNPNVFTSGKICLGTRWMPTESLDLLVERIMKLLAFDPLIVNTHSPANSAASQWYAVQAAKKPGIFPTVKIEALKQQVQKPVMVWKNVDSSGTWKNI
ncbi:MAG: ubiquitin-conjugating enzyme E2 [Candidatus Xenobiia bacterium LiM19]